MRTHRLFTALLSFAVFAIMAYPDLLSSAQTAKLLPPKPAPPDAPIRPVSNDYFGIKVDDPYRYMENLADPEVLSWMKAQSEYARATLAKIPGRKQLLARIREFDQSVMRSRGPADTLRSENTQNGETNIPEFGTVKTEAGFKALYEMSAYDHVKDGTAYPAILFETGINDPRVDPWEMAKVAARLQAATSSGSPVLLRVDFAGGTGPWVQPKSKPRNSSPMNGVSFCGNSDYPNSYPKNRKPEAPRPEASLKI